MGRLHLITKCNGACTVSLTIYELYEIEIK